MAESAQQSAHSTPQEPLSGPHFFSDLFFRGVARFQEVLFDGNPLAVAAIGVVSFLVLSVAARCIYSLRASAQDAKKNNRRRRKTGVGGVASPTSKEEPPVQEKQTARKRGGDKPVAVGATAEPEKQDPAPAQVHVKEDDDRAGEWLVVSNKRKSKPKAS